MARLCLAEVLVGDMRLPKSGVVTFLQESKVASPSHSVAGASIQPCWRVPDGARQSSQPSHCMLAADGTPSRGLVAVTRSSQSIWRTVERMCIIAGRCCSDAGECVRSRRSCILILRYLEISGSGTLPRRLCEDGRKASKHGVENIPCRAKRKDECEPVERTEYASR